MQYLYNSSGEWIAFQDGVFVYDPKGAFLGWLAEASDDVVDLSNHYFATIYGDRLYRKVFPPSKLDIRFPGLPAATPTPPYPLFAGTAPVPLEAEDVAELQAA